MSIYPRMDCAVMPLEATERHELTNALRRVSALRREHYFEALVHELAGTLGVAFAFVAEVVESDPLRARTIARFGDGRPLPNSEYLLDGTPCRDVIDASFAYVRDGVASCFPQDAALARLGIESYAGIAMVDEDGALLGWLAVMDRKPIEDEPRLRATLEIFAARTEAELHRKRLRSALHRESLHRRSAEERAARVARDAMHDDLTMLPKRTLFLERVDRALLEGQVAFAVLFIDLD